MTTGAIGGEDAGSDRETQDWVPSEQFKCVLGHILERYRKHASYAFGKHIRHCTYA